MSSGTRMDTLNLTHVIIVAAILGFGPLAADPALARQVPAAIVADPPADKEFPAALAVVGFPSHGVDLDATLYLASGRGPHGAVVLLHGLPGYEVNGDLSRFLVNSVLPTPGKPVMCIGIRACSPMAMSCTKCRNS